MRPSKGHHEIAVPFLKKAIIRKMVDFQPFSRAAFLTTPPGKPESFFPTGFPVTGLQVLFVGNAPSFSP